MTFYQYLQGRERMTVIDVSQCLDLKDIYLYAQPPFTNLPRTSLKLKVYD